MLNFNYQYKLKLNKQQAELIDHYLNVCQKVYNYALAERKDWIKSRNSPVNSCSLISEYIIPADFPYPSYNNQSNNLTKAKQIYPELKTVHSQVLQQTLRTLDLAFKDMKRKGNGFPRFKKRFKSFLFPTLSNNCLASGKIKLPKIGWVKLRQSREYPTGFIAKTARIIKKASGYYIVICFQSKESVPDNPVGNKSIGIDAGIESFAALSNGELIKAPRFLLKVQRKLKLLQRRLKHKNKGSKNWLKLQNKIARLHEKVANCRKDWHYKLANKLCDLTDNIFIEDITYTSWAKGVVRKQSHDFGVGQFFNEILPFVAWKRGKYFLKVDKNYTSQTCPNCGTLTGKKSLNNRSHFCPSCGYTESRDIAAAKVICQRGINAVGHTVFENVCGDVLAGTKQYDCFV